MKFSIRDLLWLMTLAGVLTAWGIDHWLLNQDVQGMSDLLAKEHREVNYWKGINP